MAGLENKRSSLDMTRREMFMAAGSAALLSSPLLARAADQIVPNPFGKKGMGGAPTSFGAHNGGGMGGNSRGAGAPAKPPDEFIDYCHQLGLGGVEIGPPPTDPAAISRLRDKLQTYDMHVIFNIPLPKSEADVEKFDISVKAAHEAGAFGLHAALTGRRYEDFKTLEAYQKSFENNQKMVALAEPVLRKNKVRLALENHKGWRAVEQAAWMKRLSSEYVGVHLDFGNNVSFCEDPMFTLETLKPWIFSGHIKDMAVKPYEDGFLLSEVTFGEGFLDLKRMVDILRAKDPNMPLDLEMISREPLKVPIYTSQYWVTFQEVPGQQVAKLMEIVEKNPPKKALPTIAGLSLDERKKYEEDNNVACIRYARQNLGL
jgi:sugar phosphate isomerase/epimerase